MSFQSKGFWMPKDAGVLADGDITYNSTSRIEPKRPHQWFMDVGEAELFPNKKQVVEVPSSSSFAGIPPSSLSPWGNVSGLNSVPSQLNERLFDSDATRAMSFDEGNIPPTNAGNLNMGRKIMDDTFESNSSFSLSMSPSLEDPKLGINYGGIRKVKVSEVRDSENFMPISIGSSYTREGSLILTGPGFTKVDDSGISMGLTFGQEEETIITLGESYGREDGNFISMGQSFNKGDGNSMVLGSKYKTDSSTMSTENLFSKADLNIMSIAENFSRGDNNFISMGTLTKGDNSMISMGQVYKGDSSISVSNSYEKGSESTVPMAQPNNKGESHTLSIGPSFDKGESNIISFGGHDDDANASGRLLCSYDLLMGQASGQRSDSFNQKNLIVSNAKTVIGTAQPLSSGAAGASKKKEDHKITKKIPPNNFPSNVRSLLSTGILDEVPVKYVAWSREKELRGIIKGSGYLCGCQSCNFSKVINAYEFERHAGCKTKHPNNHIYFENGKTIYGIVQELRSTQQNMLFDVIQTITGSPINQKSFRLWKESFLAATRELQRIYGKDERNQPL